MRYFCSNSKHPGRQHTMINFTVPSDISTVPEDLEGGPLSLLFLPFQLLPLLASDSYCITAGLETSEWADILLWNRTKCLPWHDVTMLFFHSGLHTSCQHGHCTSHAAVWLPEAFLHQRLLVIMFNSNGFPLPSSHVLLQIETVAKLNSENMVRSAMNIFSAFWKRLFLLEL